MFVSKFKLILIAILIMVMPIVPTMLLAQESTEEPTVIATDPAPEVTAVPTLPPTEEPLPVEPPPEETPVTTPETLLGQLFSLLKDGTYIVWASAGVVVIVGLIKAVAGLLGISIQGNGAMLLTLVVQVLIWLGYAIANYLNVGEAFRTNYLVLVDIARSFLPLFGTLFGAHVLYQAAVKRNVPIAGYRVPEKLYKEYKSSQ